MIKKTHKHIHISLYHKQKHYGLKHLKTIWIDVMKTLNGIRRETFEGPLKNQNM